MRIYTLIATDRSEIEVDMDKSSQDSKIFYLHKGHAEEVRNTIEEDYGTTMKVVSFRIADYNWPIVN